MDFALPILPPPTSPESTHLSSTTHRRIDLQSPADLAHLHHTASRAAAAKLDRDVPRNGNGEEEGKGANSLRSAVEEEVAAYIDRIFEGAGKNVFVNGVEAEAVEWRREGMEGECIFLSCVSLLFVAAVFGCPPARLRNKGDEFQEGGAHRHSGRLM